MRRNVAGQFIGAQLVSKTDGSAVTSGTTTVYVTGDAGTQAAGSVGAGACTHEGNGFWTYAPAQAETNYTHVAFTFVNTSAVNATVQVFPIAYDASGQMTGVTVGTISANVITATAIQDGAITNAKVADDVNVNVASFTANAITAAAINAGALDGKGNWNIGKTGYTLTAGTGLGNQTADITGNLSGSVGSVTGAVGSVTGAVGSVTGSVGSISGVTFPANFSALGISAGGIANADVKYVNAVQVTGTGALGDEWGP